VNHSTPQISFPSDGSNERRLTAERRHRPTPILGGLFSPGRRWNFRRTEEKVNVYVDRPSPKVVACAVAVLLLSASDALLTLLHIRAGGDELVPTMRYALGQGETFFTITKMALTGFGVLFLALHERFRIARLGFRLLLGIYGTLMLYHMVLVAMR